MEGMIGIQWIIFIGIAVVSWLVQMNLQNKFKKYSKIPTGNGMTGRDVALQMLHDNGRDAHRAAAGHCPDLCLPQCLASHLPALARVVVACVPGQSVREPGVVSLAGGPAGTHPAQGVKPLHGNAVL